MKRVSMTLVALLVAVLVSMTLVAQKPAQSPPAPERMDQFEDAHKGLFGAKVGESSEAVRRSNELAAALPAAGAPVGKIPYKNFIDEQIFGRIEREGIPHAALTNDEEFIRRAF